MIDIGQVYRIPWRCDQLARVVFFDGGYIELEWVDPGWKRTEPGLWYLVSDFLSSNPILMEDAKDRYILYSEQRAVGCDIHADWDTDDQTL